MLIRGATIEDAEAIGAVHVRSWQAAYADIFPAEYLANLNIDDRIESWREILNVSANVLVADVNGRVAGFIDFGPGRDGPDGDAAAEVYALYVHPDCWRQGIGQALWYSALAEIQATNPSAITLWVLEENLPARRFYESQGFAADGASKTRLVRDGEVIEIRYRIDVS